jgi:hypothetical protein
MAVPLTFWGLQGVLDCPFLQSFLDRFYMSRLGMHMLMSQHVALHVSR